MKMIIIIIAHLFQGLLVCQVPHQVLTSPHRTRQLVMSEAERGVSCPETLEKNIGLFAHRQQARLS